MPGAGVETNWASVGWLAMLTVVGAFAALWVQGAPVNRGMRSALMATVLFVGFLLLLVGVLGLVFPTSAPTGLLAPGAIIILGFWPRLRQLAARAMPIDPKSVTHTVALIVVVLLLLFGGAKLVANGGEAVELNRLSAIEVIAQNLALAVISFFAVGLGLRRDARAALRRLGLTRPTPIQAGLGVLVGLGLAAVLLGTRALAPGAPPTDMLALALGGLVRPSLSGLAVAVSSALGMEVLFRGAIQPRFGPLVTAMAFVALIILPPLSLATVGLLTLAVSLSLLRHWTNTTVCIIAHMVAVGGLALVG